LASEKICFRESKFCIYAVTRLSAAELVAHTVYANETFVLMALDKNGSA
jgi:hypothetical protein